MVLLKSAYGYTESNYMNVPAKDRAEDVRVISAMNVNSKLRFGGVESSDTIYPSLSCIYWREIRRCLKINRHFIYCQS